MRFHYLSTLWDTHLYNVVITEVISSYGVYLFDSGVVLYADPGHSVQKLRICCVSSQQPDLFCESKIMTML